MENALFRLSKYSGDKNVFNDYTIHVLQKTALQMDGYLNYACALGGQNGIPTLVSYADHTIHAIARRTGIQYSYAIIAMLLERLEMESLGERIIELQEDAPDWSSSRNQKRCVVALYDEFRDYFYYLHVFSDRIYVATMITGQDQYFVNAESKAFFLLSDSQFDVLGTAYMILIGLFASDAGKKSGEFFTPTGPSKLIATLATVGLDEAKTVGDCTCGSASMLLEVQKHLTTGRVGHFYGQENNATTYNLARMNMLMHGVDYQNFDIYKGDTLREDKYGDVKMTVQVCNPPYSLKYDANPALLDDPRYSGAGKLPPKSHADYAFVEHMIYHMDDDDGRVAVLLPHGVLFRGGAEEVIRKYIVKDLNRLDAVIGLAPNLFHGTSIPVCLLVLKTKRNGNSGNVLFIDASKEFKPGKNQNTLEDEHIQKIVDAYVKREDVDKFAHVADMAEIEANGWNLNIPRYVDTFEEEKPVDLEAVRDDLKRIENEKKAAIDKAESMLRQLGL